MLKITTAILALGLITGQAMAVGLGGSGPSAAPSSTPSLGGNHPPPPPPPPPPTVPSLKYGYPPVTSLYN